MGWDGAEDALFLEADDGDGRLYYTAEVVPDVLAKQTTERFSLDHKNENSEEER